VSTSAPQSVIVSSATEDLGHDHWGTAFLCGAAATAVGYALARGVSGLDRWALLALSGGFVFGVAALLFRTPRKLESYGDRPVVALLAAALVFQMGYLLTAPVGVDLSNPSAVAPFSFWLIAASVLAGSNLSERRWLGRTQVPLLLVAHFLLGAWILKTSHLAPGEIHLIQAKAASTLIQGKNPYAALAFPYLPLTLLLDVPAVLFTGDPRYAQLAAVTLAGAFMAYARPGRVGAVVASVFLFTPRVFLVLQQGWTEPFLVLVLSLAVYCACRRPRWAPFVLGLTFALKAYFILGLPAVVLLLHRPFRWKEVFRLVVKALVAAALVMAPFALWDFDAFSRSALGLHLDASSQPAPLSFVTWLAEHGGPPGTSAAAVVAAIGFGALAMWRGARSASGFATGLAIIFFAFFAFHPEASFNHYFLVVGALCCAVSAIGLPGDMGGLDELDPVSMITRIGKSVVGRRR
jgi:hypothetical protein